MVAPPAAGSLILVGPLLVPNSPIRDGMRQNRMAAPRAGSRGGSVMPTHFLAIIASHRLPNTDFWEDLRGRSMQEMPDFIGAG